MTTLQDCIGESLQFGGRREAIVSGPLTLNFEQLSQDLRTVTEWVGKVQNSVVAIVDRGDAETRIAYLGCLWAGVPVVPIASDCPPERYEAIIEGCGVSILIDSKRSGGSRLALNAAGSSLSVFVIKRGSLAVRQGEFINSREVAYVLHTSGSTGVPKGVPISSRSVLAFIDAVTQRFEFSSTDRFSSVFQLVFDVSVFDALIPLVNSAVSIIPRPRQAVVDVASYVASQNVTVWFSVPSLIAVAYQLGTLKPNSLSSLRHSLFIGEPLSISQVRTWADAAPFSRLYNVYGPTEATVACSSFEIVQARLTAERQGSTLPIGEPFPGVEFTIGSKRDGYELLISGDQVFDGYLYGGSSDMAFEHQGGRRWYRSGDRVSVEGGQRFFAGRIDRQIKLNGYRIELTDIEETFRQGGASWAHARVEHSRNGPRIVLFMFSDDDLSKVVARAHAKLPTYMHPAAIEMVSNPPRLASGKIDLKRLARG